jgi:glycosyltransferase involved in cell wall biosynthesis/2-polyprenyl-3-methyl-5-hydroxy-6-metoxy-1,4-benzoquinol methylase
MKVSLVNLNLITADAIGTCIIEMARFFRERGDSVRIYVEHPPEGTPDDVAPLVTPLSLGGLIASQPHFDASDLAIYHYPTYYGLLESIRGVEHGAVLLDYHGVTPPELWGSNVDRELLVRGQEGIRLVEYADLAVVHSPFTREELASGSGYPVDRIKLLPLGVPLDQFQPGPRDPALVQRYGLDGQSVLLFVGRMAGNKRIDVLVQALARSRGEIPETKLLLVGDCDSSPAYREVSERVRALAATLDLTERVIFAGRVADLPAHYRLADVFVTASLHEGFGVPMVEAMACGVPVVTSASGALPWTIGEAGLTFPSGDDVALADQVVRLLADTARRAEQIERGLARAHQFSLAEYRSNLARLVEETLERAGSSPKRRASSPSLPHPLSLSSSGIGEVKDGDEGELAATADVMIRGYVVRSDKPIVGPLIAWVRRNLTSHLREPYLDPILERQVTFNARVVQALRGLGEQVEMLRTELSELRQGLQQRIAAQQAEQTQRWETVRARLGRTETSQAELGQAIDRLNQAVEQVQVLVSGDPAAWQRRSAVLRRVAADLPDDAWARIQRLWDLLDRQPPVDGPAISYTTCNEWVGGDPDFERELYTPFVAIFAGRPTVLDVGCGRGVFLELCRESGIPARGIDLDSDMVKLCRAAGLEVGQADALNYLAGLTDASLGGIFCAHLIEHLPKPDLVRFLELCQAKLRPGSPIVLITPNGASLTIFHATFYKDLTHRQPIHPQALEFLLEATGFERVRIETLSPLPESERLQLVDLALVPPEHHALAEAMNANLRRLNDLIFGDLDCAATAYKPAIA